MKSDDRLLLQLAPLIYVAWSDGILTADELSRITAQLASVPVVSPAVLSIVNQWLDPARPPTPSQLNQLVTRMKRAARGRRIGRRRWFSLSQLGRYLARADNGAAGTTPELEALRIVEQVLGIEGSDALNAILGVQVERAAAMQVDVSAQALYEFAAGDRLQIQRRVSAALSAPESFIDPAAHSDSYKQRVFESCRYLAGQGFGLLAFPAAYGGGGRMADSIAAFETIAFHDLSLLVKFGVQFGLFGGSVLQLGTERHHERYLQSIGTLELPGCFAMTETAHGSNVRDLETTATYDAARQEFVIHTPNPAARKDYIGNAALHGRMATVFAQLEVASERHGVHAFLVPIRSEQGAALPGVSIEDCGLKAGLNGVDNGLLSFDQVRIPRENLLNRFADVSAAGVYSSPIPSASRRFFTMLGTLVAGRISIACAANSAAKLALTIATRYAVARRQFGPEGGPEVPILTHQAMQRVLLTRMATTYALDFALHGLVQRFAHGASEEQREVEVMAASLKAYASWHGLNTVQACREACGGAGYMFENRFGVLREDVDIFTTFEGANVVLQQLVAKGLLSGYREQFGELRVWSVIKFMTARASAAVVEQNIITRRRTEREHLRDPDFHEAALRFREQRLLSTAARRLKARLDEGLDSFAAINACQGHLLALANAHAERLIFEAFRARVESCGVAEMRDLLQRLCALFVLQAIERDRAWYLESDYMEAVKTKAIRNEVIALCAELLPGALTLADGFGIPDHLVRAPIAGRD